MGLAWIGVGRASLDWDRLGLDWVAGVGLIQPNNKSTLQSELSHAPAQNKIIKRRIVAWVEDESSSQNVLEEVTHCQGLHYKHANSSPAM